LFPAHRVITEGWTLGGFSVPVGILLKQKILELEGERFYAKGKVAAL
jgi:O6-methylguanine-DNA--protein-cysteine methyltransferase